MMVDRTGRRQHPRWNPEGPSVPCSDMAAELVGGQALIDGVMIRRGTRWAAAVRRPDGTIATTSTDTEHALAALGPVPVLRGVGALVDSVRIGLAAMRWSRTHTSPEEPHGPKERAVVALVVTGVVAAFLLVPLGIAALVTPLVGDGFGMAVVEGVVRLALFVAYLAMLSRLPGVRTTLEYHGAEHMVVAGHEHGVPRTVAAARRHSVRHPRCGTDFFLLIFVISIVAFALVGPLPAVALVASRVLLAPVVVGVAYEVLRAGGAGHSSWSHALAAPGLWLQRFTTREPSDDQIEVAIAALDALTGADAVEPAVAVAS